MRASPVSPSLCPPAPSFTLACRTPDTCHPWASLSPLLWAFLSLPLPRLPHVCVIPVTRVSPSLPATHALLPHPSLSPVPLARHGHLSHACQSPVTRVSPAGPPRITCHTRVTRLSPLTCHSCVTCVSHHVACARVTLSCVARTSRPTHVTRLSLACPMRVSSHPTCLLSHVCPRHTCHPRVSLPTRSVPHGPRHVPPLLPGRAVRGRVPWVTPSWVIHECHMCVLRVSEARHLSHMCHPCVVRPLMRVSPASVTCPVCHSRVPCVSPTPHVFPSRASPMHVTRPTRDAHACLRVRRHVRCPRLSLVPRVSLIPRVSYLPRMPFACLLSRVCHPRVPRESHSCVTPACPPSHA